LPKIQNLKTELPKIPKTTKKRPTTEQKIFRPKDSENDQFGRKRPNMATLAVMKMQSAPPILRKANWFETAVINM
jgi:hypothetical protein